MAKLELLSPAGGMEKLETVLKFGADAVFLGGKAFNLRAQSQNFSMEELKIAVDYCHSLGKKIYVTLNIIAHNKDIKALPKFVQYLDKIGVDAVIVADLGVLDVVKENSNLPVHISTQASNANWRSVKMYHKLGAKRVILARELSLDEIKKIKDMVPDCELEAFVHGAMCMAYSGRCNISSYVSQRDSNHGMCSNSCRWKYSVVEEKRPGEYFPIFEDESGSYIYNSKDLCTIEFLDKIVEAGLDGLKIEGRGKGILYGALTAKMYKEAMESYKSGSFETQDYWLPELKSFNHRGYTTGFFFGKLDRHAHRLDGGSDFVFTLAGVVKKDLGNENYLLDVRNKLTKGQKLNAITPIGKSKNIDILELTRVDEEEVPLLNVKKPDTAQPNQPVVVKLTDTVKVGDILRYKLDETKEWIE